MNKQYDVVVYGASGFTGRLVAEYLHNQYSGTALRWAMAGRNEKKLEQVRQNIGCDASIIIADSTDKAALDQMTAQTKVVCTTVGPYAKYGNDLLASCVTQSAHYCDLSGEVPWMRRMIDAHHEMAKSKKLKIVHSCGFDSIPSDYGLYYHQNQSKEKLGAYCSTVSMRVRAMKGKFSGGTLASGQNVIAEAIGDASIWKVLMDPYGLNPTEERTGKDRKDLNKVVYDPQFKSWIAPFVMGNINTKIVRRGHALRGFPYGSEFQYDEAILTGNGWKGKMSGKMTHTVTGLVMGPKPGTMMRKVVDKFLPDPGEGPSEAERKNGFYKLLFKGKTNAGESFTTQMTGDMDPGYGSTSKMLGEAAVCLAMDQENLPSCYGVVTPVAAMGDSLGDRLIKNAGLTFSVKE